jgi:hypothetical protein
VNNKPKVYLIDIETSPIMGYTWGTYDQSVLKILEPSKIISVAWKELGSDETIVKCIADYPGYKKGVIDDILDDADVLIAHHGDSFDIKKLNARFVWHKLHAPSSYQTVDTLKVAKKHFKFDSNSLNNLGMYFNLGEKIENGGFGLWVKCIAGDPVAWEKMKAYNAQDVDLLEKVYLVLRPYQTNHPNLNLMVDKPVSDHGVECPSCLSTSMTKRGYAVSRTGKKQRYQCQDCGSWSSGKFEKSSVILTDDE